MTPAEAKNTFHKLMLQSQKRKLTLTERERLTVARQTLRRNKRPAMNTKKTRPAINAKKRFSVYRFEPGRGNEFFASATTELKAKKLCRQYCGQHGGFVVGAGGKTVFEIKRRAPYTPLSRNKPRRRRSTARGPARRPRPKQNGRVIRMGKLVELRYERDHGSKPGFYKHEFRSKPVIFYYPASNKIVIEGR